MYETDYHKSILIFFTLAFKNVKISFIIGISILISTLINLPRALQLFNIVDHLGKSFDQVSVLDIVLRVCFLFLFSWTILQFNSNWKFFYAKYSKALRLILTTLINAAIFLLTLYIFIIIYEKSTGVYMTSSERSLLYFIYFVVLLMAIFIAQILRAQITHQQDSIEKELLKQQSLQNELEALKNQINPHFLFNSLNSLSALVRDNKQANTFVSKLSFMYRYILQSGQENMVTLSEELKFLESYIYLIQTRYRDRFSIKITIPEQWMETQIPSMSLQLLVENAVKHNEISGQKPLQVKVYVASGFLVVENMIQPRTAFVESTGQGLANINKRYKMLKQKAIIIKNTEGVFSVKLPLE